VKDKVESGVFMTEQHPSVSLDNSDRGGHFHPGSIRFESSTSSLTQIQRGEAIHADEPKAYRIPFAAMTIVFFIWGFMMVWNDLLIPRFKDAFALNYFRAMLVQLGYNSGYFIGALIYFIVSVFAGDPIARIGYKNGVAIGFGIAAVGAALFYPAALALSYGSFIVALFIMGLGFAMIQIAANPYVILLGSERTASGRLNLAQGFNSAGTTLGPVVGGWLIFQVFSRPGAHPAEAVKAPYLCCSVVFLVLSVGFGLSRLPGFANKAEKKRSRGALAYPHTVLGIVAIFMYVGSEVSIGSSLINFLGMPKIAGLSHVEASRYLSFYWGGLMAGRFMGGFAISDMAATSKRLLLLLVPVTVFGIAGLVSGWSDAIHYGVILAVILLVFIAVPANPPRMLTIFSLMIITLLVIGWSGSGSVAEWAVLGTGLFCSIMWSNIFSLAIEGLGPLKSQASSLLIMAILGAAIIPPLQGATADRWGIQASFLVPALALSYVTFYGLYGWRAGRALHT